MPAAMKAGEKMSVQICISNLAIISPTCSASDVYDEEHTQLG